MKKSRNKSVKKEEFVGRRPDGKVTFSANVYLKAWRKENKKLEKLTGMKVIAFDPDFQLAEIKEGKFLGSFSLPVWAARKLKVI